MPIKKPDTPEQNANRIAILTMLTLLSIIGLGIVSIVQYDEIQMLERRLHKVEKSINE